MKLSTVEIALFVLAGFLFVAFVGSAIMWFRTHRQSNLASLEKEATTTGRTTDLEKQQAHSKVQPARKPGFTFTDEHGHQSTSPTEAGRKAWSDPLNPPPLPPLPVHRLPGDWDLSFLISKPAGITPSICFNVTPPIGKTGDARMEVLKHEGKEQMCVRLKLGPPLKLEKGKSWCSYWGRFVPKAPSAKALVGVKHDEEKEKGKSDAELEAGFAGGDVE